MLCYCVSVTKRRKQAARQDRPERVRVVGYCRVSTDEQRDEGVSLAAQKDRVAAYATAQDLDLVGVEVDAGISGKVPPEQRPGLASALDRIRRGEADGIVALKLDRISRCVRSVLDLADSARQFVWRLISVSEALDTGTATGRFTLTILAALAQLEREQVSERTAFALAAVAREGRVRSHRTPFGFRTPNGSTVAGTGEKAVLVEDEIEQDILAQIVQLHEESGFGARRIAKALNGRGIGNPRTGGHWTHGTIGSILRTIERRRLAMAA